MINSGSLIPLLIMLPNILWSVLPRPSNPNEQKPTEPTWLTILEKIGRVAVLILPFFYQLDLDGKFSIQVVIVMSLSLILYYAAWVRYFLGGRSFDLLKAPLFGIPLPMAVFPLIFLLTSSLLMNSWMMFAATIFFGIVHIWVSAIWL